MYTLIAHHRVNDFATWRKAAAQGIEKEEQTGERGIVNAEFYQTVDGQSAVFLLTFRDLEAARAHEARLHSEASRPMLESIGVVLPATVLIVQAG